MASIESMEQKQARFMAESEGWIPGASTNDFEKDWKLSQDLTTEHSGIIDLRKAAKVISKPLMGEEITSPELRYLDDFRRSQRPDTVQAAELTGVYYRRIVRRAQIERLNKSPAPDFSEKRYGLTAAQVKRMEFATNVDNEIPGGIEFAKLSSEVGNATCDLCLKAANAYRRVQREIMALKKLIADDLLPEEKAAIVEAREFERARVMREHIQGQRTQEDNLREAAERLEKAQAEIRKGARRTVPAWETSR